MSALRVLHQGVPGCPLMVLGIGMQHTPEVLSNLVDGAGISRVAEEFRLGPLPVAEAFEAIHAGLSALGHDVPESSAKALAEASMGFPQHIHGYLAGACEAIRKHGSLASGPPLAQALAIGDDARVAYYEGRLRLMSDSRAMLPVIRAMNERGVTRLDIDAATHVLDAASFDGAAVVREAIAHGVLTRTPRSELSSGIPSFHGYMRDWLRQEPRLTNRADGSC